MDKYAAQGTGREPEGAFPVLYIRVDNLSVVQSCFQGLSKVPLPVVILDADLFSVHISRLATAVVRMGNPYGEEAWPRISVYAY